MVCRPWLGRVMMKLHTKIEVSMFTQYEDMKGNAKWVVWSDYG